MVARWKVVNFLLLLFEVWILKLVITEKKSGGMQVNAFPFCECLIVWMLSLHVNWELRPLTPIVNTQVHTESKGANNNTASLRHMTIWQQDLIPLAKSRHSVLEGSGSWILIFRFRIASSDKEPTTVSFSPSHKVTLSLLTLSAVAESAPFAIYRSLEQLHHTWWVDH
jgi:hypothetical protein